MNRPRILLSIPNTLSSRNLLRSDVLPLLKAGAERIVIVAPFADRQEFRDEFVADNVVAYPMARFRPRRSERVLQSAAYNLHLGGQIPFSIELFLRRWSDNHPRLGPVRTWMTRQLIPRLQFVRPSIERLYTTRGATCGYEQLLSAERPDLAVFSRLFYCDEIPLMRAAVNAGIPTLGVVASWDNLTTKGPLLPRIDRLLVWNEHLRREAIEFHGYRDDQIAVTGAPHHDMLYRERDQLADRATFFSKMGLDPSKRLITYAGEDPTIAPDWTRYVELLHRWVTANRFGVPCQLLVRPHPQDFPENYERVSRLPGIVFDLPGRPLEGQWMDMNRDDLRRLYETLQHSDVVVNVTSTIVIDASFFDTPSVCIGFAYTLPDTFYNSQMRFFEMDHFRHVLDAGATTIAETEEALFAAIDRELRDPGRCSEGRRRIAREIAHFQDGRSGCRVAEAIFDAARNTGHPKIIRRTA